MPNYFTFMRKEFTESIRTKRFLVLACVFLFFAITTPLLTRFMGEFFNLMLPSDDESSRLIVEALSNPSWQESYVQFYSQISQIGIWAVLFMYMGTVQREIRTGTASLMFSKGLGFGAFILAKFTMAAIVMLIISAVSSLVVYAYTFLLFDTAGQIGHVLTGSLIFSIGAIMILAVIIFCSSLTKSSAVSGGLSFGVYFLLVISTLIPRAGAFSPLILLNHPVGISVGNFPDTLLANILIAAALAVAALFFATQALKKAEG